MDLGAIAETLEGCVETLRIMDEESHDSRYHMMAVALKACIKGIDDALDQTLEKHQAEE